MKTYLNAVPKLLKALRVLLVALLLFNMIFIACQKTEDPGPLPTITSFTPASDKVGATIIISGTNFAANGVDIGVFFGLSPATVITSTETQITAEVPPGATTGKIVVTRNGLSARSATDFVVISPPTLLTFKPISGSTGDIVIIEGANFSANANNNLVLFNGIPALVKEATTTQLIVTVPSDVATGPISVIVDGLRVNSIADFTILRPPTIISSPTRGLPGEILTITGSGFQPSNAASYSVKVHEESATITEVTETQLKFIVPLTASTGDLDVTLGSANFNLGNFEVLKDIPRNGLVAFFPFRGNANSERLNGNEFNGDVNGPVLSADRFGNANSSYSFDGVDDFISIENHPALQIAPDITLGAWVKVAGAPRTINVLSKIGKDGNDEYHGYTFHCYTAAFEVSYLHGLVLSGTTGGILTKGDWSPEEWTFLAVSQQGDQVKIYQNNIKIAEATGQRSLANIDISLGDLLIGKGIIVEDFFSGSIDDVFIYNRALSETEITQLFQQTVTKYQSN